MIHKFKKNLTIKQTFTLFLFHLWIISLSSFVFSNPASEQSPPLFKDCPRCYATTSDGEEYCEKCHYLLKERETPNPLLQKKLQQIRHENDPLLRIALFREAMELDPFYEESYLLSSELKTRQKDYKGAIEDLEQLLKINPINEKAICQIATIKYNFFNDKNALDDSHQKIWEARLIASENELKRNPDYWESWHHYADALAQNKKYEKAAEAMEKSIELHKGSRMQASYKTISECYEKSGQPIKALEYRSKIINPVKQQKQIPWQELFFFFYYVIGIILILKYPYHLSEQEKKKSFFSKNLFKILFTFICLLLMPSFGIFYAGPAFLVALNMLGGSPLSFFAAALYLLIYTAIYYFISCFIYRYVPSVILLAFILFRIFSQSFSSDILEFNLCRPDPERTNILAAYEYRGDTTP